MSYMQSRMIFAFIKNLWMLTMKLIRFKFAEVIKCYTLRPSMLSVFITIQIIDFSKDRFREGQCCIHLFIYFLYCMRVRNNRLKRNLSHIILCINVWDSRWEAWDLVIVDGWKKPKKGLRGAKTDYHHCWILDPKILHLAMLYCSTRDEF